MLGFIIRVFGSAVLVFFSAYLLDGVSVTDFWTALLVALILGIVNAIVRPLVMLLTLPINVITLGLFTFVVNAFMITIVDWLVSGFTIDNFWTAIILSIIMGLIGGVMSFFLPDND